MNLLTGLRQTPSSIYYWGTVSNVMEQWASWCCNYRKEYYMATTKVKFVLEKETPGALKYQEVTNSGEQLTQTDPRCLIGPLYLRKFKVREVLTAAGEQEKIWPRSITVSVTI